MKKLLSLWLLIATIFVCFSGCSKIENNAVILNDNASNLINRDFYNNNYVRGALYENDFFSQDESYPTSRYFLVRSKEEFERVFALDVSFDVDFTSEMLLVYTFRSVYVRPIKLKALFADAGRIHIELNMKQKRCFFELPKADACSPFQRYVIIKMNKVDVSEYDFTVKD